LKNEIYYTKEGAIHNFYVLIFEKRIKLTNALKSIPKEGLSSQQENVELFTSTFLALYIKNFDSRKHISSLSNLKHVPKTSLYKYIDGCLNNAELDIVHYLISLDIDLTMHYNVFYVIIIPLILTKK
jgi:hypothetical protein